MRYWVVKGNPRVNDLDHMLRPGRVEPWRTAKPPRHWRKGDRIFFWSSAPRLELVGLGELLGPTGKTNRQGDTLYEVKYLTAPLRNRVRAAELRAHPICRTANFLKPAVAQGILEVPTTQAQSMYELMYRANGRSLRIWSDLVPSVTRKEPDPVRSTRLTARFGQGFGDPDSNKKIEQRAVTLVVADYRKRGWLVRSVERDKCGYDLECRRNGSWQYVEVKGIRGTECSFFLSAGELAKARAEPDYIVCAVTNVLVKPQLTWITSLDLEKDFRLDPIAYHAVPIRRK